VLFGATAPLTSELAGSVPAFTLAGVLYVGAAIAVLPSVARHPPSRQTLASEWRPVLIAVVAGGAIGPLLLVAGLARTNAATASILLNAELAATVAFAAVVFREHLGGRLLFSAGLITFAGAVLAWEPGAAIDLGALLIVAACVAWGIDNVVTARTEQFTPQQIVAAKGVIAGGANLAIGLLSAGWGASTDGTDVIAALMIGAAGYGLSITLWVKGARDLGASRAQVIFATAPFIGAAIAWTVLGDPVEALQVVAVVLAAAGVGLSLRSGHEHRHRHDRQLHDHEHSHDDDHHDAHHDVGLMGRHGHPHRHAAHLHAHPHVPDLHHRHDH
jgi:drug/metabolite transporter (DMT)-like permease